MIGRQSNTLQLSLPNNIRKHKLLQFTFCGKLKIMFFNGFPTFICSKSFHKATEANLVKSPESVSQINKTSVMAKFCGLTGNFPGL